uniref:DUF295 domain-containing protein n=1 Tax=Panagrellus redivivus TaxID=6233 RepID=A0A7E4VC38_PANRE
MNAYDGGNHVESKHLFGNIPAITPLVDGYVILHQVRYHRFKKGFYIRGKKRTEVFYENCKYLRDIPDRWLSRLSGLALWPRPLLPREADDGIVVEIYNHVALIFIGSRQEMAVAFRRVVGKKFDELHPGARVLFRCCTIANPITRYVTHAVAGICSIDHPVIELDEENNPVFWADIQLHTIACRDDYCLVWTDNFGKVMAREGSPMFKFIHSQFRSEATMVSTRVHYNFVERGIYTSYFEFDHEFLILQKNPNYKKPPKSDRIPLLTDYL